MVRKFSQVKEIARFDDTQESDPLQINRRKSYGIVYRNFWSGKVFK